MNHGSFNEIVLEQIEVIERNHKNLPSHQKHDLVKAVVKQVVQLKWGKDEWVKHEPTIDELIHFIIFLSKHRKLLANINRKCCSSWCGWCIGAP
jgi:hypothetical protein